MELMKYESIRGAIPDKVETDEQFDKLIADTSEREQMFLLHKKGREIWHGLAYGALTENKQKTEYRNKFELPTDTVRTWSRRVKNRQNADFLDNYHGSHIDAVNNHVPDEQQEEWLGKAREKKWTAKFLEQKAREEFDPQPELTADERVQVAGKALIKALRAVETKAATLQQLIGRSEKRRQMYVNMGISDQFIRAATEMIATARRLAPRDSELIQIEGELT